MTLGSSVPPLSGGGSIPPPPTSPSVTTKPLTPEYIYTTDLSVENFGVQKKKPALPKNNLSPPTPYIPHNELKPKKLKSDDFLDPLDIKGKSFCIENPHDARCHDEKDAYKSLGLFTETESTIFNPEQRSDKITHEPVHSLYEQGRDDTQLDVKKVSRTECRCKDGSITLGYYDNTTGQKDCSSCNERTKGYSNPSPYKNYVTKKRRSAFTDQKIPLSKQVGVSNFGKVKLKEDCNKSATRSIQGMNKAATLNKVINRDTVNNVGGSDITDPSKSGLPVGCTLYDSCNTNVYGI